MFKEEGEEGGQGPQKGQRYKTIVRYQIGPFKTESKVHDLKL